MQKFWTKQYRSEVHETTPHADLALQKLKEVTNILFEIWEISTKLTVFTTLIFDMGFKCAKGDVGVMFRAAAAWFISGIFVINLHLKSFRESERSIEKWPLCDALHKKIKKETTTSFGKLMTLLVEDVDAIALPLKEI